MTADISTLNTTILLESGDRLTRKEFERRYQAMPDVKKAELIEGVAYVASPLRYNQHGKPHSKIIAWLQVYAAATVGVEVADNTTVRLDGDNEPQPDALLRLNESQGGQSRVSQDDYIEGAPELIVEIAASTAAYDLHDKMRAYRRNRVWEYLVWLPQEQDFRWYVLQEEGYVQQEADSSGIIKSRVFPGLWLAVNALLADKMQLVLAVLQEGIESEDHQNFLKKLIDQRIEF
ncbi:MAG: Uma2 family endonuclease [Leptolyngbyaceae cyanobacterium]